MIMKKRIGIAFIIVMFIASTNVSADQIRISLNERLTINDITDTYLNNEKSIVVNNYCDYNPYDWYGDDIVTMIILEGMSGYPDGTIKPNQEITYGEFIKMLIQCLYGTPEVDCPTHWACPYVTYAKQIGLVGEDEINRENVDSPISRLEVIKMIMKANTIIYTDENNQMEKSTLTVENFDDVSKADLAIVEVAYSIGIINGYEHGLIKPLDYSTRAEASTMIIRLLKNK